MTRGVEEDSPCDEEKVERLPVYVVPRPLAHVGKVRGLKGHELAGGLIAVCSRHLAQAGVGGIGSWFLRRGRCREGGKD